MFKRIVVALVLTVALLLAQPVLILGFQPLANSGIGWVTGALVSVAPLLLTVALLGVIWLTALRLWKVAFCGLPGFRPGLSKSDWQSLSKAEKRAYRALYSRGRKIVTDAGLAKKSPDGVTWFPRISGWKLTPAGIQFSVGGVALIPGVEIEKAIDSLAAAIPGPEPLELIPSGDVRYAHFVLRTRDPFADLEGLSFDDAPIEQGTLDDFLDEGSSDE